MRRAAALAVIAVLGAAGCTDREPRSARFFELHPTDLRRAQAACARRDTYGAERAHAELAQAHRDAEARMRFYSFAFRGR